MWTEAKMEMMWLNDLPKMVHRSTNLEDGKNCFEIRFGDLPYVLSMKKAGGKND